MSYKCLQICLKFSLVMLFLLFLQPARSQGAFAALDEALQTNQKVLGKNLVAMVWKAGDTLVHKKELGEFNSKTQAPLGAASQWLTAALVMVFVDEGKLSLDDKVSRWLPEFARYGKNYITLRTCLAHMTGIKDSESKLFKRTKKNLPEEVDAYASREIRANPTQDFWYGEMGPNIAGRVLEIVSKKNFDVLIKQKLFTPLTMRRTSFSPLDGSAISPASGALTTADDYIKFLAMLMNKGKFGTKQVLSEESVNTLLQIQAQTSLYKSAPKEYSQYSYALGSWVMAEQGGKPGTFVCPGFDGNLAIIDLCKGYALLLLLKEEIDSEKPAIQLQLKAAADESFGNNCP